MSFLFPSRGIARIFQRGGGGGGGGGGGRGEGVHTASYPVYLHSPLQMLCPENGVCNYLALEKIYGMLTLRVCAFSPPELLGLYVAYLKNDLAKGGGGGAWAPQDPTGYTAFNLQHSSVLRKNSLFLLRTIIV